MSDIEKTIINQIKEKGPITFEDFMNIALYDKQNGYYSGGKAEIGKKGDYYTSPHVHSAFGEVIANFILKAKKFISNDKFTIIEIGSGKGYLALDILNHISSNSDEYNDINYIIIEKYNEGLTDELLKFKNKINICNNIDELSNIYNGIIISNELFDSLPFHKIVYKNNKLMEYYIDYVNGKFYETVKEISDPEIFSYIDRYKLNFVNLKHLEVNLLAGKYLKEIAGILNSGFILTIDYGFLSEELFSNEKPDGTYRCFYKHTINSNTYQNIGNQDITADVDFSNLILTGNKIGLEKLKYTTQAQFLIDWGILDIYEESIELDKKGSYAIKNLFLPGMMGNYFKVLIQMKNIKELKGFYPDSELKVSFGIN